MAALDLVIDGLAEVVQKAGPLDGDGVEPELGGHDRGQIGHFERMVQHVLAERGAIAQTSQGVDELRVEIVDARIERGLLAGLVHPLVHQLDGLVVHLLDARGMDAPVGDEVLHGDAADLAAHRVEAGDGDALRRVVDDEVRAGQLLERADVAALAADDAALQIVGGDMDGGHRALGGVVGGHALDGEAQDLAGLLVRLGLGTRLGITDDDGRFAGDLVVDSLQQLLFGLLGAHARSALEGLVDLDLGLLAMALDGVFGLFDVALAALDLSLQRRELVLAGIQRLDAAIEGFLALGDAVLGGAHLAHALLVLLLHLLLVAKGLVLGFHGGFTSERLGLLLGILDQACGLAGSVLG